MKSNRLMALAATAALLLPLSAVAHTGGDGGQHHALLGELAHAFEHLFTDLGLLDVILLVALVGAGVLGVVKLTRRN
ncbi:hypothetical protein [Ottowia caeni]|uniref:hypothetical protein n=1 Tax=Ottowia caeni TaxID=2870339 RepID=UPI001E5D6D65|nr:hypothetical protein [Ottowia caeni]